MPIIVEGQIIRQGGKFIKCHNNIVLNNHMLVNQSLCFDYITMVNRDGNI